MAMHEIPKLKNLIIDRFLTIFKTSMRELYLLIQDHFLAYIKYSICQIALLGFLKSKTGEARQKQYGCDKNF
jgi:hypothetical protein